ncbi:MAG: glycosyltransferase family 2 protein [Myxococcaceae bacterium]|nr:glycosyltransferase family 2 protein [Myxococcaceae bacterium]
MSTGKARVVPIRTPQGPVAPLRWCETEQGRQVLSLLRAGASVAVVGREPEFVEGLNAEGFTVLHLEAADLVSAAGGTQETDAILALRRAEPDAVLLGEGWLEQPDPRRILAVCAEAAPRADLAVMFWNAASASLLLQALAGQPIPRALQEAEVREWLLEHGYVVRHQWSLPATRPPRALPRDTENALRCLFEQLQPRSSSDRLVYWARRSADARPSPRMDLVPGLLSVVMRHHSLERLSYLDQAVFSLACQQYAPLEIVVATQCPDPSAAAELSRVLERHRPIGGYTFQVVSQPSDRDIRARLLNLGIASARGQYLAFLDDDDVVYPHHYRRLIDALRSSDAAWAFAEARRAFYFKDAQGDLYCRTKDRPYNVEYSRARLLESNFIPCHAYVVDRFRVGSFPLAFAEEANRNEDYILLLRLCALFQPIQLRGPFGCEHRLREDGSNSMVVDSEPPAIRRRKEREWLVSLAMMEAYKRKTFLLLAANEMEDEVHAAVARLPPPAESPLRYQLAERLNQRLKEISPRTHRLLKKGLSFLVGR